MTADAIAAAERAFTDQLLAAASNARDSSQTPAWLAGVCTQVATEFGPDAALAGRALVAVCGRVLTEISRDAADLAGQGADGACCAASCSLMASALMLVGEHLAHPEPPCRPES